MSPRHGPMLSRKTLKSFDKNTLKRLLNYFGAYKALLAVVVVCVLISAIASAASSLFLRTLIDDYITPLIGVADPDMSGLFHAIFRITDWNQYHRTNVFLNLQSAVDFLRIKMCHPAGCDALIPRRQNHFICNDGSIDFSRIDGRIKRIVPHFVLIVAYHQNGRCAVSALGCRIDSGQCRLALADKNTLRLKILCRRCSFCRFQNAFQLLRLNRLIFKFPNRETILNYF